jgi:nucleoside 2-deoxyribosyltransferase
VIVKHDFWCVDHADIIIANFTSLSEGYPSIGSLVELGRATARGALIYILIDSTYSGHETPNLYKLHPFLEQTAAVVFHSLDDLIAFLDRHLDVLSGADPRFDGTPAAV